MRKNLIRDFAVALFVIAAIVLTQATGSVIPASHVFSFGNNVVGQLGIGSNSSPSLPDGVPPTGVIAKERFIAVDGGGNTSIAISSNGSVLTWGVGFGNGLGYPVATPPGASTPMERIPKPVPTAFNAFPVSVSAGSDHMLAAFDDGKVWSWGTSNSLGQLGHPLTGQPGIVSVPAHVVKVSAGGAFSLAIDDAGQLWGWGANNARQLGVAGAVSAPIVIPDLPALSDVSAGLSHSVALGTDGTVWSWGQNTIGTTGQPPSANSSPAQVPGLANIVAVAAGGSASFALAADGSVWAWGLERSLGVGSAATVASHIPRQVQTVVGTSVQALTGVRSIAAGDDFAIAGLEDGRFAVWSGVLSQRALGLGGSNSPFPMATVQPRLGVSITGVSAGSRHAYLMTADPSIATSWQAAPSVGCQNDTPATLTLDGYSVAGGSKADIMLVLDESGSIAPSQFALLKSFATNFVQALDIGADASRVGIVMFSTNARPILAPSASEAVILSAINAVAQRDGYTCISCGIDLADSLLDANPRTGATRYIVVVTDGVQQLPGETAAELAAALNASVTNAKSQSTLISVGIGASIDVNQLKLIASTIPGTTTMFTTPDFDSLEDVIEQLTGGFSNPGATNALLSVDLGPQWQLLSNTPSGNTSSVTVTGPHSFTWSVPELDASGVSLQLQLRALAGGTLPLPASQAYTDDQNNAFDPGSAQVSVVGCPATLNLQPDNSTGVVDTPHVMTATLLDDYSHAISGAFVQFTIVGGPRAGMTLGTAPTNGSGVAIVSFTSPTPATETIQATLTGNPLVSNLATRVWLPPNHAPIANAGADQSVVLAGSALASVTLDGTASTDDGERQPLTYSWVSNTGFSASGVTSSLSLPRGVHTFTLTVDDGELQTSDTVVISVVDVSPAVITPQIAGALGQNGWYISDVSVSFSFDDPESGISSAAGCEPQAIVSDTLGQTFTCDVTNGAGITASSSQTVRRDATNPIVNDKADLTGLATSADGAHAPYSSPGAFDATSGLVTLPVCVPPSGSLFAIGTTTVTCTATDNAGNIGTNTFHITVNDPTPPVIVPVVTGTLGNGGWYRSDVLVSWTVNDPNSGVGSSNGCDATTISSDTASVTFTCTAANNAGVSNSVSTTIKRDATAPDVSTAASFFASAATSAGSLVNYAAATAADALSGVAGAVICAPAPGSQFPIGTTQVTCSVDDEAGNTGSASFNITVGDTTPPSITSSVTGTPGGNGWFTSPVQIVWTVNDPQSSVSTTGCDTVTLSSDTPGVTITCGASSAGGSASGSEAVKIDQTAPSISTPGNIAVTTTSQTGTAVSYSVSASDAASGLAGPVACSPVSGSMFLIGVTTVNCSAADAAGNTAAASFTVTVSRPGGGSGGGNSGGTVASLIGQGHVVSGADKVFFDIDVRETTSGGQAGSVDLRVKQGTRNQERFEARAVTAVTFTSANSVSFRGTGKWDGQTGFTYVVNAVDNGEPGQGSDTVSIEVRSPGGALIYSAGGVLTDGNIQAKK